MRINVITATNTELDQQYAEKARATWQFDYQVYWEHDETEIWHKWRQRNQELHPERDFKHTWQRFSHKVEAQVRALQRRDADYLIWLDTDVVQCKPIVDWQTLLPKQGDVCSYLGRGRGYHPETGWIAYDCGHPRLEEFVEELVLIYLTDRVFTLEQWHDAYVWDHVCRELEIPRTDLGPQQAGEAFGRSVLKEYFLHLKGPRKQNIHTSDLRDAGALMRKPIKNK